MSATQIVKRAVRAISRRVAPAPIVRMIRDEHGRVGDNALLIGRKVLVTGAGRNIGRAIALEMARQGATIYFTDSRPEAVADLERELASSGAHARGFVSDIANDADVETLCATFEREGIGVDVLVNNVGIVRGSGLRTMSMAELRAVFETNVFGPLQLTQRIVNALIAARRPGSILFVTSVHQWTTHGSIAYSASKAALGMVIKELALELAPHGIRVNGIAPGDAWANEREELRPFAAAPLSGSSIHPAYIGRDAVYLTADHFSQFTTGSVLTVDAGLLARQQNQ